MTVGRYERRMPALIRKTEENKMKTNYLTVLDYTFNDGLPCKIGIIYYNKVNPNPSTWDSDWDYYGYTECEWELLDRKGYRAKWMDYKLTEKIEGEIDTFIEEEMEEAFDDEPDCGF